MKLLVLAHTPPPHHGQSYMVKLLVDGFGGDRRRMNSTQKPEATGVECYHVNARFSDGMEDIGTVRAGKVFLLLRYCMEALWCRFRYGANILYYVPAPGKKSALYRDWAFMLLCRPFFNHLVLHWQGVGLGRWLEQEGSVLDQFVTKRLLGKASLSIVLGETVRLDADLFLSRRVEVVPNGIPDPAPDFNTALIPERLKQCEARRRALAFPGKAAPPEVFQVLFLAHCTRSKGLFDTIEGVRLANRNLALTGRGVRIKLTVAGAFINAREEQEFKELMADAFVQDSFQEVEYAGFVSGSQKSNLLRTCHCFCFPSYYEAEGLPVNLIEAMAHGLAIITTRWRAIPEILPEQYSGFVSARAPEDISAAIEMFLTEELGSILRAHFLAFFTEDRHLALLKKALEKIEL